MAEAILRVLCIAKSLWPWRETEASSFSQGGVSSQVVFPRCRSTDFRLSVGSSQPQEIISHQDARPSKTSARQPMPSLCASDSIAGRLDGDSQLADGGRGKEESR